MSRKHMQMVRSTYFNIRAHTVSITLHLLSARTLILSVLKETVHLKMNSLSSFTLPQVDPNLYECVCSEHKGRYSEEWGKQSSIFLLLWKSMVPKTAWLQTFFTISSFVFRTNTFIQVWIYLRLSNWWQTVHF